MKKAIIIFLSLITINVLGQCTFTVTASYTAPTCSSCCNGAITPSYVGTQCSPNSCFTLQPLGLMSCTGWTNLCPGSYTVEFRDGCFCLGTCGVTLPSGSTGINENNFFNSAISIFPNPVSNILYISSVQKECENSEIEIANYAGQTVLKLPYKTEIDVSKLQQGVYILKVHFGNTIYNSKFIKE